MAIFVDDRLFHSDSLHKHAKVQSKAVFSYAMTVMDTIYGWIDEEKNGGLNIFDMDVDLHQRCACRVAESHSRNAGVPEADDVIHYAVRELGLCRSFRRPLAGIRKHNCREEKEVMGKELDDEICIPCVAQWSMLWSFAPTRINQTLEGEEINIATYHEVVDMAIAEATSVPFGGFAHTANVHVDNGGCSFCTELQREIGM